MTIVVKRRHRKASKVDQAVGAAREAADRKLATMENFLIANQKKENRLKAAAIRRYAKKRGLELEYHPKPWIFRRISGEIQIAMPAGYFARVNRVLHQIVAD